MKKKLSIVLAVYNEEENLKDCLETIKDLAWEIVVVDGGSKDKTLEIAKSFHAKVLETDNPSVFHINKNKAIDAATGDWILQLDADERVSNDLAEEIKKSISKSSDLAGFWIPRQNYFLGRFLRKGGQYPDYTLRLYRKGKGRLPAKDVHEQAEVNGKVGFLKNNLIHLGNKNFSEYIDGLNKYTDLLSFKLEESRLKIGVITFIEYIFIRPLFWFLKTYIRHKGFMDGFPGFVFALFSALRFPIAYIKLWNIYMKGMER